jgi:tetratricopeptide (TPR) repeat protein
MTWRAIVWVLRIAAIAAVLYGVWCGAAYFLGKHYFRRGMVAFASNPPASMQQFAIAAKLQPKNARYQAAHGRAALKAGQFPQAAASLQRAASLRPDDFGIWHDLGQAYLKADAPAESVRAYKRALEIRPDAELALTGLAEAASKSGDAAAAIEPLRSLYACSPKDVGLAGRLASALVTQGKADEALQVCSKIRAQALPTKLADLRKDEGPTDRGRSWCTVLAAEGDAALSRSRWADAILAYQRCLLIDPSNQAALTGLTRLPSDVARQLAPDRPAHGPSISPDGKQVAFLADGLYTADLASGVLTHVPPEGSMGSTDRPAWSPDGSQLCFGSGGRLHVVNADGTGDHLLVKERAPLPHLAKLGIKTQPSIGDIESFPSWSPNGKAIAFCLRPPAASEVELSGVVELQTGKVRCAHQTKGTLPKFAAGQFPPAWSADGRVLCGALMYSPEKQAPGLTLWSADAVVKRQIGPPREGLALAGPRTAVVRVCWGPDSRHLAALLRLSERGRTVLVLLPVAEGRLGRTIAKDVVAFRWRDASHLWLLQKTGDTPLTAATRELTSDLRGKLTPGKQRFPFVTSNQFDLSRDRRLLVTPTSPGQDSKGLLVFDLRRM